jgi:hypothetical protein
MRLIYHESSSCLFLPYFANCAKHTFADQRLFSIQEKNESPVLRIFSSQMPLNIARNNMSDLSYTKRAPSPVAHVIEISIYSEMYIRRRRFLQTLELLDIPPTQDSLVPLSRNSNAVPKRIMMPLQKFQFGCKNYCFLLRRPKNAPLCFLYFVAQPMKLETVPRNALR